jgi:hypothetical protein
MLIFGFQARTAGVPIAVDRTLRDQPGLSGR